MSLNMLEVRRCLPNEIDEIADFIHRYWKTHHVLAVSRPLMDWQHRSDDGSYNYIVAKQGDRLLGILGYILTHRY